jgi:predicted NBD/HSP70 family sugar kinase
MIASFDIGGTSIKYGLINEKGKLIKHDEMPTNQKDGGFAIMNQVIEKVKAFQKEFDILGVAISSAGVIHPDHGVVLSTTGTIKDYDGLRIKDIIETETNCFTTVENDVNCAALAETVYGDGKPKDFIAMTVGTGIGGAIVSHGHIVHGASYSAGEWGRLIINGKPYEHLASTSSIVKKAIEKGLTVSSGKELFELYDQGNNLAQEIITDFYFHLSSGIVNLVYALNPKMILIGGGISDRGDQFINELKETLSQMLEPYFMHSFELKLMTLKNHSGMLGAYIHHTNKIKELH